MAVMSFLLLVCWSEVETPDLSHCGPVCLTVAARAARLDVSLDQINPLIAGDGESSFSELERAARTLGLSTVALRWHRQLPAFSQTSAIIPVLTMNGQRHFVTVLRCDGKNALVLDFPSKPQWLPIELLVSGGKWDGNALHLGLEADIRELRNSVDEARHSSLLGWLVIAMICATGLITLLIRPKCMRQKHVVASRGGFTAIELLVCLSIMGILVSLIAPAVQASREAARSIECRNHLKQLGTACQSHHATYGHFPAASLPYVYMTGSVIGSNLSVHARLLPFLENDVLFKKLDVTEDGFGADNDPPTSQRNPSLIGQRVPVFECPSDRVSAGATNYRVCLGTGPAWYDSGEGPLSGKEGAFFYRERRDRDIVDGLSQTVFFSEKLVGDQNDMVFTANRDFWLVYGSVSMNDPTTTMTVCPLPINAVVPTVSYGGASWLFSGYDHTWYNHIFTPNASTPDCSASRMAGAFTARSYHPGGVHAGFGDGAVRFVNDHVDLVIWRSISSRRGREAVAFNF